jgi:gamma-glutamyltranspeptidase/glutathione hydrolase
VIKLRGTLAALITVLAVGLVQAGNQPVQARNGMVVSINAIASRVGAEVLQDGGNAVDAAVAVGFALAVVHPSAGNIGGGGFLMFRDAGGDAVAYDFREQAPAAANAQMYLQDGEYSSEVHHRSALAIGVPGTVAGMHLAWSDHGKLPWARLLQPAISLARDGFELSYSLAGSMQRFAEGRAQQYPATVAAFTKNGEPYEAGEVWKQPDLAKTLEMIAADGPKAFYEGEVARALAEEMVRRDGMITEADLANYEAKRRTPIRGTYRGYEIISMPPPSSGGTVLVEMLNMLEGYDVSGNGFGSAANLHLMAEAMRRAYADRARYLGDPDFNPDMPIDRLTSKAYATQLAKTIQPNRASVSSPDSFEWPAESQETTHYSVVDKDRNAVSVTYTLEGGYGVGMVVPGYGFLLNNELGDFNAGPGITNDSGLIGTEPNLAAPGKRPLSSMTPTIVEKDGALFMVTGSPGGRTIINTVLGTILNAVDHGMNAQEAVDAGRIHHQWLPDQLTYEAQKFSPDTLALLTQWGHTVTERSGQGTAEVIINDIESGLLEGGNDYRGADGGAAGVK